MNLKTSTWIYLAAQTSLFGAIILIVHLFGGWVRSNSPALGWAIPGLRNYAIPEWVAFVPIGLSLACVVIFDRVREREKQQEADSLVSEVNE